MGAVFGTIETERVLSDNSRREENIINVHFCIAIDAVNKVHYITLIRVLFRCDVTYTVESDVKPNKQCIIVYGSDPHRLSDLKNPYLTAAID